jgi:hypothetical protein
MAILLNRIQFEPLGIGTVLKRKTLVVPLNQRDYAWEEKHVVSLMQDFTNAIRERKSSYFLGTIVLTGGEDGRPEVADGQQRLATTSILLAAIRDYFFNREEKDLADSIQRDFLTEFVRETKDTVPHVSLNINDNEFYRKRILLPPNHRDRKVPATIESHRKIERAAELAAQHIQEIVTPLAEGYRIQHLNEWAKFVEETALVIVLTVPDDLNAFVMFETLNDRGLKTSQFDLLKNYLFKEAADRISEAQTRWAGMTSVLESTGIDELGMMYLRHFAVSMYGHTRDVDVYERIKDRVKGRGPAISFLDDLSSNVNDYISLLNQDHARWDDFEPAVKQAVATMILLRVIPIRPLMLAVMRNFQRKEVTRAFRAFVCWTVRFLVASGNRSGVVEEAYARCALDVSQKKIKTTKELEARLKEVIPSDARFEAEFAVARVSRSELARYYIRSLELSLEQDPEPEFVPNSDLVINLEHILPRSPGANWPHIEPEKAAANYTRIGNLVLLQSKVNSVIGNSDFATKKPFFMQSSFVTTKNIGNYQEWGIEQIDDRQKKLAKVAVKTWPFAVK